jgi:hypothetical protein
VGLNRTKYLGILVFLFEENKNFLVDVFQMCKYLLSDIKLVVVLGVLKKGIHSNSLKK